MQRAASLRAGLLEPRPAVVMGSGKRKKHREARSGEAAGAHLLQLSVVKRGASADQPSGCLIAQHCVQVLKSKRIHAQVNGLHAERTVSVQL